MDLAVVGLGYVGLPLCHRAIQMELTVVGLDISSAVVDGLNSGRSHITDLRDADVEAMNDLGFRATCDETVLQAADTIVVCVPTPLGDDGGPDLTAVEGAMSTVGRQLRRGTLVVLESTTYPGTTEEVALPILEEQSGLTAGTDFNLAFSPERIDPGNLKYGVQNTPKVVGGLTQQCRARASDFYGRFIDTIVPANGLREAETAKLLENTYRHINIALVNELAQLCHELDIDVWEVIRLAATKPFGFQAFYPGPGVGGHCIPIDPNYLNHRVRSKLGYPFRFVELAQEINASMPTYIVRRIQDLLNLDKIAIAEASILILGVSYKPDISDQRESPAIPLAQQLVELGAHVTYHDPRVQSFEVQAVTHITNDLLDAVREAHVTVLVQNHAEYDVDQLATEARHFFDTRGVSRSAPSVRL